MELTKEQLRKVVEEVFSKPLKSTSERRLVLKRFCSGLNNFRDYGTNFISTCNDPECKNCREFDNLINTSYEKL